jgi:hypothetical protein
MVRIKVQRMDDGIEPVRTWFELIQLNLFGRARRAAAELEFHMKCRLPSIPKVGKQFCIHDGQHAVGF